MSLGSTLLVACVTAGLLVACTTSDTNGDGTQAPASLAGTQWRLVRLAGPDGGDEAVAPADRDRYTLAFGADGRVAVRLDCNRGAGAWKAGEGGALTLGQIASTRAFCAPPSLGDRLGRALGEVRSYSRSGDQLVLTPGALTFEPAP